MPSYPWSALTDPRSYKIKELIRQPISEYDLDFGVTIEEMVDGRTLWATYTADVSGGSGGFTAREVLNFAPSGATGQFVTLNGATLYFILTSATVPTAADTVTGADSMATRDIDSITEIK